MQDSEGLVNLAELSQQQKFFFDQLKSGGWDLPTGLKNLGIDPKNWLKEVSYGRVRYEWNNDGSRNINSGRVFGGWIAAMADHIVSMTMASALKDDEWFTTMELTTRMFRPMEPGLITIHGNLISRGRTTGYVEANFTDERNRLIAKAASIKAIRERHELMTPDSEKD